MKSDFSLSVAGERKYIDWAMGLIEATNKRISTACRPAERETRVVYRFNCTPTCSAAGSYSSHWIFLCWSWSDNDSSIFFFFFLEVCHSWKFWLPFYYTIFSSSSSFFSENVNDKKKSLGPLLEWSEPNWKSHAMNGNKFWKENKNVENQS
jgi:hypothetical protein